MRHRPTMAQIPFDAVGFDLDGTLLDTFRDLGTAVNHALVLGGFTPVPVDSSKDLIGGGAKRMLARAIEVQGGISEDAFRPLYKAMLGFYAEHNADLTTPFPGMVECLDALAARGVKLAVVTNKFESFARAILAQLGLDARFVTVIGGDTMGKDHAGNNIAKPAPDPLFEAARRCGVGLDRFVYVGDSSYDVAAARAAGVPVVVAAYGYCDKPAGELGGDAVIESPGGLIAALEAI